MRIPVIRGIIDRRILVNYRVDPGVLAETLPPPFRPTLVHGMGMAGICLIRLRGIRPTFVPSWLGISSENVAHRTAVEWTENGVRRQGVFVRRRDTSSLLNGWAGGRIFPGIHHRAAFAVEESGDRYGVRLRSDDGVTSMSVMAGRTDRLPSASVFGSLEEASEFFRSGGMGYSATNDPRRFQGLELKCRNWKIEPVMVDDVRSSFFDDASIFPTGSIAFDSAFLMRDIRHEWHGKPDLCIPANATRAAESAGGLR